MEYGRKSYSTGANLTLLLVNSSYEGDFRQNLYLSGINAKVIFFCKSFYLEKDLIMPWYLYLGIEYWLLRSFKPDSLMSESFEEKHC